MHSHSERGILSPSGILRALMNSQVPLKGNVTTLLKTESAELYRLTKELRKREEKVG